nr:MAG TPA_asm: hypothetical protein [Caudoviricetes sp.]
MASRCGIEGIQHHVGHGPGLLYAPSAVEQDADGAPVLSVTDDPCAAHGGQQDKALLFHRYSFGCSSGPARRRRTTPHAGAFRDYILRRSSHCCHRRAARCATQSPNTELSVMTALGSTISDVAPSSSISRPLNASGTRSSGTFVTVSFIFIFHPLRLRSTVSRRGSSGCR